MKEKFKLGKKLRFHLRSVEKRIAYHYHTYGIWDMLFILSSGALVIFGILVQILWDKMGYTPYLPEHLFSLIVAIGLGCLFYFVVVYLPRYHRKLNALKNVLLTIFFLILALGLIGATIESAYEESEESYRDLLIGKLISRSHFLGHGAPFFEYSDELAAAYNGEAADSLSFEVLRAYNERLEVGYAFHRFQSDLLLLVLSYVYGFWIFLLSSVIAIIWCVSAIGIYLKIYSRWLEWIYLVCFLLFADSLLGPILTAIGIFHGRTNYPFLFDFDPFYMNFTVLLLSTMFVVIRLNRDTI